MSWSNTNKFSYDRWTRLSFFSPSILIISSIHSYTIALPFSLLPPFLPLLRFFYSHSRTMNTRIPCIKNNNYYNNIRITQLQSIESNNINNIKLYAVLQIDVTKYSTHIIICILQAYFDPCFDIGVVIHVQDVYMFI